MSPATHHVRRFVSGAVSAALMVAVAPLAYGDPKPGSSGHIFGPPVPTTKKVATTVKKTTKKAVARTVATLPQPGLGQGAKGDKVLALQTRLAALHYDVEVNGLFDYTTLQALLGFQKVNDLPRTGRATDSVFLALETAVNPAPMIPGGGQNRIEVDLKRQYLGLYKEGALFRLLPISSGSGKDFCVTDPDTAKTECDKAITPGGSFRIRSRIIGWRESKLGLLYNPLYFNGGIAFHGAPVVPAQPASHGCVRIPMPSAEWFPNEVADGTAVYVFGGEKAPVPLGEKAPTDLRPNATAPSTTIDPALTVPGGSTNATGTTTTIVRPGSPTTTVLPGATTSTAPAGPSTTVASVASVAISTTSTTSGVPVFQSSTTSAQASTTSTTPSPASTVGLATTTIAAAPAAH